MMPLFDRTVETIDQLVESFRSQYNVPAVMLGIKGASDLNYIVRSYGTLSTGGGPAPGPTTIFEIGSVTKTFTCTALAWLESRGLLSFDDPVQSRMPPYPQGITLPMWTKPGPPPPPGTSEITFLELADYSPGLPDDSRTPIPTSRNWADLAGWISDHPDLLDDSGTVPGTTYAYADAAFEILGSSLAYIGGQTFTFAPLLQWLLAAGDFSMPDTVIALSSSQQARLAPGYANGTSVKYAPGEWLIKSTMSDMMEWLGFNMGLLSACPLGGLLPVIQQPRFADPSGASTGLGWFFNEPSPGITRFWKDGVAEGFSSYIAFVRGAALPTPLGLVILTNQHNAKPPQLGNDILNLIADVPANPHSPSA